MKTKMKKCVKVFVTWMLVCTMALSHGISNLCVAEAATRIEGMKLYAYIRGTKNVNTYSSMNEGKPRGYIEPGDKCEIIRVESNGWLYVRYPIVGGGHREMYVKSAEFFCNTEFELKVVHLDESKTVYTREDLSTKFGTVYGKVDDVIIIGNNGHNATQIIYNLDGNAGYKMGWISGIYTPESCSLKKADIESGYYIVRSIIKEDSVWDIRGGWQESDVEMLLYPMGPSLNQCFLILKCGDYYCIIAYHSNRLLRSVGEGFHIIQGNEYTGKRNLSDCEMWSIYEVENNQYRFINKQSGYAIDIAGAKVSENGEGTIISAQPNTTPAQRFTLTGCTINGEAYSEEKEDWRECVVDYLNECARVEWTPINSFTGWKAKNTYYAGKKYYGIPYNQVNRNTDLEKFNGYLNNGIYIGTTTSSFYGSDCSSAICMALRQVNENIPITATYFMFPSSEYFSAVGSYYDGGLANSATICKMNGRNVMYDSYSQLQPGDLLLQTEHVMLVTEVGNDWVKVTHQTMFNSNLMSTWRVNEKLTFSWLYENNYIPVSPEM